MLKVKVCGLTDPENLKDILKTSPDFIGYNFCDGSKRYVGKVPQDILFRYVPESICKTGVFVNEDLDRVTETIEKYQLDFVQLHGNESAGYCKGLAKRGFKIIKAFEVNDQFDFTLLKEYEDACEYFLFDNRTGHSGGSGLKFTWNKLSEYYLKKLFFLAGGIGPEDVLIIKQINHDLLYAVDINSRFELYPGMKDPIRIKKFIDEIKR